MTGWTLKGAGESLVMLVGSAALLLAMATDFISVVGRHLGWDPPGVVEVVQFCVVAAISAALVIATLRGAHASVHIVTERLRPAAAEALERISNGLGALLMAALALGSGWMLAETWAGGERSDVLSLPIAPARIIWTMALAIAAILFGVRALRRRTPDAGPETISHDR